MSRNVLLTQKRRRVDISNRQETKRPMRSCKCHCIKSFDFNIDTEDIPADHLPVKKPEEAERPGLRRVRHVSSQFNLPDQEIFKELASLTDWSRSSH